MFGPNLRSLFTSRWMALLWAIWICVMAAGYVGSSGSKSDDPPDKSSMDAIANALG